MNHRLPLLVLLVLSLFLFRQQALATDDIHFGWKPGLAGGQLVPDSTSPDGKWALFVVNRYDMGMPMTATAIVVADTHRTKLLGLLPCLTPWMTDLPCKAYLTIQWSPDGRYLAIHDSTPRNSVLLIYHVTATELKAVTVPDLRRLAANQLQIPEKKITSSGQVPQAWSKDGDLVVRVRLSIGPDVQQKDFTLHVSPEGAAQVSR
jgi:dipeptidyl aminopeptidase/acylaminoacyl peptidase